jgi:zinc transport system permease protein
MSPSVGEFFDAWELFRAPALTGVVCGSLLGVLGVYVLLRRMVFVSAAISQAAGLGVAIGFFAHLHLGLPESLASPVLFADVVTILAVLLLTRGSDAGPGSRDALLGVVWLVGAAGTLALGTRIVQEIQDIETLLFGSAVAVMPEDFRHIVWVGVVLLLLHAWWWRGFVAVSFDRAGAVVRGLPVPVLETALMISLALSVAESTRVVGALPSFAFTVLPAMVAVRIAGNLARALVIAGVLGGGCGFAGYVAAFLWELPVGAAQTLVAVAVLVVVEVVLRVSVPLRRSATA